jgi:hypothetical protein
MALALWLARTVISAFVVDPGSMAGALRTAWLWLVHCGGPWLYGWCTVVDPGCVADTLWWALAVWLVHCGGPWL